MNVPTAPPTLAELDALERYFSSPATTVASMAQRQTFRDAAGAIAHLRRENFELRERCKFLLSGGAPGAADGAERDCPTEWDGLK